MRPRYRRAGLGRKLAEAVIAEARDRRLVLETLPTMQEARTLYASLGTDTAWRAVHLFGRRLRWTPSMGSVPPLLTFLLMVVSGWVHRRQLIVIEFLQAENRLLKERLRGKRIRFTDAERTLLARKAKAVGRKVLRELETIVSPDTLMPWHRRLVAEKWNFAHRRGPGRPGILREIAELIVRMGKRIPNGGTPGLKVRWPISSTRWAAGRLPTSSAAMALNRRRSAESTPGG
ncbi:MAG: GNAT family N-acetyltransferase, partial [Gammaproteobacteria bacterium]|nr:GNAT family N-acetyltransferase [Gammaproteobacteria bacterium]